MKICNITANSHDIPWARTIQFLNFLFNKTAAAKLSLPFAFTAKIQLVKKHYNPHLIPFHQLVEQRIVPRKLTRIN
jgi:hypothetical protein